MNIIRDGGDGITVRSLEFWNRKKHLLGRIIEVAASKEPLYTTTDVPPAGEYGFLIPIEYNLRIIGTEGMMYLSGCNCGYSGEGPNGTRQILEELGVTNKMARALMAQPEFSAIVLAELEGLEA